MSVVAYGMGLNSSVAGGYAAYGFGILELFPAGIIGIIAEKVYKEFRIMTVGLEPRNCEIEYINRNLKIDLED